MSVERLIKTLSIQSDSRAQFRMFAYIIRQLKALKIPFYVNNGNIYATKGKLPAHGYPAMVCHMDTVHAIVSDLTVVEVKGNLTAFNARTMMQTGIGGDDKVGVYLTLECLRKFPRFKAAFFRDEETGCQGSYLADMNFFENVNFVLQCDRKGHKDFITSASCVELSSKEFQADVEKLMTKYGYGFTTGLMTDVMALKERGLKCSSANMSCGYYNPHMKDEFVSIYAVQLCWMLVIDIISTMGATNYPHAYTKPTTVYTYDYGDSYNYKDKNAYKGGGKYPKKHSNEWYAMRRWDETKKKWVLKNEVMTLPGSTEVWDKATKKWVTKPPVQGWEDLYDWDNVKKMWIRNSTPMLTTYDPDRPKRTVVGGTVKDFDNWVYNTQTGDWVKKEEVPTSDYSEDIYCADCRAEIASKNGLCSGCFAHYQGKNYYKETKTPELGAGW